MDLGRVNVTGLLLNIRPRCLTCGGWVDVQRVHTRGDTYVIGYLHCGTPSEHTLFGLQVAKCFVGAHPLDGLAALVPEATGQRPYPPGPEVP